MAKQFVICAYSDERLKQMLWTGEKELAVHLYGNDTSAAYYTFVYENQKPYVICEKNKEQRKVLLEGEPELPFATDTHAVIPVPINSLEKRQVSLDGRNRWSIGRKDSDILLRGDDTVGRKHAVLFADGTSYRIEDLKSINGTYVNGKRITSRLLRDGDVIQIGHFSILYSFDGLIISEVPGSFSEVISDGKLIVKRAPRKRNKLPSGEIQITAPPAVGTKPETNWLSTLLPAGITIALAVVMATVMGNSMMLLYTLPMTLGGIVVSVLNYRKTVVKYQQNKKRLNEQYDEYLQATENELKGKYEYQLDSLLKSDPEVQDCIDIARYRSPALWQRRPSDEDFVMARVGQGDVNLSVKITVPKSGFSLESDPRYDKAEQLRKEYSVIRKAPIVCDLSDGKICGVIGNHEESLPFFENLFVQLCTLHCYTELKVLCIYDKKDEQELKWIQSIPHFQDDERSMSFTACSLEAANELFKAFSEQLKQRKLMQLEDNSFGAKKTFLPHVLVAVLQPSYLDKRNPINEYLFRTKEIGASLIMLAETFAQLPKECSQVVELEGANGELYTPSNEDARKAFVLDSAETKDYRFFSECLQDLYCEDESIADSIPKKYTFFEMYGIHSVDELDPQALWEHSNILESMSVPIGIGEGGKPISLDLHERGHGPHGLVAGTVGSGKSELLQSYILSAALNFSPQEVSFLLIDFKGGGMASQFFELPHLVGTITNLDGYEVARSLASIQAELDRRQRLFKEQGVISIEEYIKKYRSRLADTPIPHLVIIVDEFAELKQDQPEVMTGLIRAARIGRSLGVHLILATQKPAGQVSDQIWSNSHFQICLKVLTLEDSNDMIKSPLAAEIRDPGRAYLRVGYGEVFELFQSAYSGAEVSPSISQLRAVVQKIREGCDRKGIIQLPPICLPPLSDHIELPKRLTSPDFGCVYLGLYDDPKTQHQGPAKLDVFKENTIIVGAAQKGKTTILRNVIRQLCEIYSPEEINLYILDMGSQLRDFEAMPHVGGVVTAMEGEKLKNLFKLLSQTFKHRRDNGYGTVPQIVVFLDNYSVFIESFGDDYGDVLINFLQNGLTYGISFILTSPQTAGLGYKHLSVLGNRIVLSCNESSEYSFLLDHCRIEPKNVAGRALIQQDKNIYEMQCYLPFPVETEMLQNQSVRAFVEENCTRAGAYRALPIPEVPKKLNSEYLRQHFPMTSVSDEIPFAIDYDSVECVSLRCFDQVLLGLTGRNVKAKDSFLLALLSDIENNYFKRPVDLYIIDGYERKLSKYREAPYVKKYSSSSDALSETIESVYEELKQRMRSLEDGGLLSLERSAWIIVVVNNRNALDTLADDDDAQDLFNEIYKKYAGMKVLFLVSDLADASVNSSSAVICRKIRDDKKLLYFGPLKEIKITDVYGSSIKNLGNLSAEDDAYFFVREDIYRVKTIQEE